MKLKEVSLRRLKDIDSDYKLLEKWYQQKEIYSQFEQRILNYNEIKNKYYPRTKESTNTPVYIIEYNQEPVGIIQYKEIDDENKKIYKINTNNSYEIDIFIGELNYHNKGIGTKSIELISEYLFNEKKANLLIMCPLKDNKKATSCYQKCGFEIIRTFTTKDTIGVLQEYNLMKKCKKMLDSNQN